MIAELTSNEEWQQQMYEYYQYAHSESLNDGSSAKEEDDFYCDYAAFEDERNRNDDNSRDAYYPIVDDGTYGSNFDWQQMAIDEYLYGYSSANNEQSEEAIDQNEETQNTKKSFVPEERIDDVIKQDNNKQTDNNDMSSNKIAANTTNPKQIVIKSILKNKLSTDTKTQISEPSIETKPLNVDYSKSEIHNTFLRKSEKTSAKNDKDHSEDKYFKNDSDYYVPYVPPIKVENKSEEAAENPSEKPKVLVFDYQHGIQTANKVIDKEKPLDKVDVKEYRPNFDKISERNRLYRDDYYRYYDRYYKYDDYYRSSHSSNYSKSSKDSKGNSKAYETKASSKHYDLKSEVRKNEIKSSSRVSELKPESKVSETKSESKTADTRHKELHRAQVSKLYAKLKREKSTSESKSTSNSESASKENNDVKQSTELVTIELPKDTIELPKDTIKLPKENKKSDAGDVSTDAEEKISEQNFKTNEKESTVLKVEDAGDNSAKSNSVPSTTSGNVTVTSSTAAAADASLPLFLRPVLGHNEGESQADEDSTTLSDLAESYSNYSAYWYPRSMFPPRMSFYSPMRMRHPAPGFPMPPYMRPGYFMRHMPPPTMGIRPGSILPNNSTESTHSEALPSSGEPEQESISDSKPSEILSKNVTENSEVLKTDMITDKSASPDKPQEDTAGEKSTSSDEPHEGTVDEKSTCTNKLQEVTVEEKSPSSKEKFHKYPKYPYRPRMMPRFGPWMFPRRPGFFPPRHPFFWPSRVRGPPPGFPPPAYSELSYDTNVISNNKDISNVELNQKKDTSNIISSNSNTEDKTHVELGEEEMEIDDVLMDIVIEELSPTDRLSGKQSNVVIASVSPSEKRAHKNSAVKSDVLSHFVDTVKVADAGNMADGVGTTQMLTILNTCESSSVSKLQNTLSQEAFSQAMVPGTTPVVSPSVRQEISYQSSPDLPYVSQVGAQTMPEIMPNLRTGMPPPPRYDAGMPFPPPLNDFGRPPPPVPGMSPRLSSGMPFEPNSGMPPRHVPWRGVPPPRLPPMPRTPYGAPNIGVPFESSSGYLPRETLPALGPPGSDYGMSPSRLGLRPPPYRHDFRMPPPAYPPMTPSLGSSTVMPPRMSLYNMAPPTSMPESGAQTPFTNYNTLPPVQQYNANAAVPAVTSITNLESTTTSSSDSGAQSTTNSYNDYYKYYQQYYKQYYENYYRSLGYSFPVEAGNKLSTNVTSNIAASTSEKSATLAPVYNSTSQLGITGNTAYTNASSLKTSNANVISAPSISYANADSAVADKNKVSYALGSNLSER